METIYFICATAGGTLLVCQFLMALVGLGGHHDFGTDHDLSHDGVHHDGGDHDGETSWFVGILTFRTIVAALTFFGLTGLAGAKGEWEPGATLVLAMASGFAAMFLVASLMRALHKLKSEGTVRIERAVGATGTVYLTIPGKKSGVGKVTLNVQNRTMEYEAITPQDELATGTEVVAVAVVNAGTIEVVPVASLERASSERVTHG